MMNLLSKLWQTLQSLAISVMRFRIPSITVWSARRFTIEKLTGSWFEVDGREMLRFSNMNWQTAKVERVLSQTRDVTRQSGTFKWIAVNGVFLEFAGEREINDEYWVWPSYDESEGRITLRSGDDYNKVREYKRSMSVLALSASEVRRLKSFLAKQGL